MSMGKLSQSFICATYSDSVSTFIKSLGIALALGTSSAWALNPPEPDPNPTPDLPVTLGTCPDYRGAINLPPLEGPKRKKFSHWQYRYLSRIGAPYHMVHDEIVNPSESVTIVGKFDYNLVTHKDLEHEVVHAYLFGAGMDKWEYLGNYKTDSDGKVHVPVQARPAGEYIVRMIVEGDLSWADGFISVVPKGQETVLFDIDGTLTTKDFEQVGDYLGTSVAASWDFAKETVQAYVDKGYRVIYVTGRPYWNTRDTREWFTSVINLPQWHLRTNNDGGSPLGYDTETFKRKYLTHLQQDKGLKITRAYGNASTDISAYADAGIPASETWIIGKNAGNKGTQALHDGYRDHYMSVVQSTPDAMCRNQ
ncbi:haloacid dehalogenase [Sansalvadorimonas sp. 2012CJ34-2]|uniref:Haloacid dehalogenase n=1 Tax=Parendozoicomonas callyspongiae TaxID=2942213 RepID=A0ABT0PK21_9GAMM|nr:haloacid dehalogenase [Sansalvadorimonas sp. 2012CJ34-2]MCL6271591.1 haloacid dehalogenase [Sansalvadorimonas sp. 2012CJ34-2]